MIGDESRPNDPYSVPRPPKPPPPGELPDACSEYRLRLPALKSGLITNPKVKADLTRHGQTCASCSKQTRRLT